MANQTQLTVTFSAPTGLTDAQRTNPNVFIQASIGGTILIEESVQFNAANGFSVTRVTSVAGTTSGTIFVGAFALASWGDGTPSEGSPTIVQVGLSGVCGVLQSDLRPPSISASVSCIGGAVAVEWTAKAWNGPNDASKTNSAVKVVVSGAVNAPVTDGAFNAANDFTLEGVAFAPGNTSGAVAVTVTVIADWGDGAPPIPPSAITTLQLAGDCTAPTGPHTFSLPVTLTCTAGNYDVHYTAIASDYDGSTAEARSNPFVFVTLSQPFDVTSQLGAFEPTNNFSFDGHFTVPGNTTGPVILVSGVLSDWGDGAPVPSPPQPSVVTIVNASGDCTPPTAPGAPTSVAASAGPNEAVVTWAAPVVPLGHQAPTAYTVTASTAGA
ncbi:MAG TPA: hypothetical protein PLV68_05565, partial [Ilumatobacteraceae bacterium]|nr:hypothetical protein [Ilumatobacteraceae bacterium]